MNLAFGTAPALDTDRLTLRGHGLADFADSLRLWSDPDVTRYIGGRPFTEEEVWSRLLRYAGHWSLLSTVPDTFLHPSANAMARARARTEG
jgi:RimJ/RimL family protein N-acetyltransferase